MELYNYFVQSVKDGKKYKIDLNNKSLIIENQILVNKGNYNNNNILFNIQEETPDEILNKIRTLYINYKYSLPTDIFDKVKHKYFIALSMEKLLEGDAISSETRDVAYAKLVGYILLVSLSKKFKWNEIYGNWFYKDKDFPELIILRSWVE